MPPPLHVAAFEKFNGSIPDHLEATIAFGLFLVSDANGRMLSILRPMPPRTRRFIRTISRRTRFGATTNKRFSYLLILERELLKRNGQSFWARR